MKKREKRKTQKLDTSLYPSISILATSSFAARSFFSIEYLPSGRLFSHKIKLLYSLVPYN